MASLRDREAGQDRFEDDVPSYRYDAADWTGGERLCGSATGLTERELREALDGAVAMIERAFGPVRRKAARPMGEDA